MEARLDCPFLCLGVGVSLAENRKGDDVLVLDGTLASLTQTEFDTAFAEYIGDDGLLFGRVALRDIYREEA